MQTLSNWILGLPVARAMLVVIAGPVLAIALLLLA